MFAKFFKPKWQSDKADVRIRAISRMLADTPEQLEILSRMAQTDSNPDVRKAAIARLQRPDLLLDILRGDQDSSIRSIVSDSLCRLIAGEDGNLSDTQRLDILNRIDDQDLLTHIAMRVSQAELQQAAIARVSDESSLETLTLNCQSAQTRRLAAERLTSEAVLDRVGRQIRQRDKTVYRIVRDKLQQIRDRAQAERERQARREELVERFEQLARGELLPQYAARIDALSQEWQKLDIEADALETRCQQALRICRQRAEQALADEAARADRQRQLDAYREQRDHLLEALDALGQQSRQALADNALNGAALNDDLQGWQAQWNGLPHDDFAAETDDSPARTVNTGVRQIEQLAACASALEKAAPELERLLHQPVDASGPGKLRKQQQRLDGLIQQVNWPAGLSRPPCLKQAHQRLDDIADRLKDLHRQQHDMKQTLEEQLDALEQAISEGHVKQADKHHQHIEEMLELLNGKTPAGLDQQFKQLHAQLMELKDWQGFAVTPKKEQLCAEMEQLIDSDLDAPALADAIRRLQQQWKVLDRTDPYHAQALWRRFKEASDRAYAPCEAYFAAQGERRRENLKQRGIICDQLEAYLSSLDWKDPDWKAIETISHAAKQEWKQYAPVDRGPGKAVQQRFNAVLQQLDQPLHDHYHGRLERKRELVNQAEILTQADNPQEAAQEAKQLQQAWKQTGKTFRNQEQRLWKQFRAHCDAIFSRLDQSQRDHRLRRTEQHDSAEQLCRQLEQLLESPASRDTIGRTLKQAILDFTALDDEFGDAYTRRFDDSRQRLERQCAEFDELQNAPGFQSLRRRIELCEQQEQALGSDDPAVIEPLQQDWDALPACSVEYAELIEQRFQLVQQMLQEPELLPELVAAAGQRLRQLCIQLEIALGLPSPDEDQALRLEYQMQRLQQALEQQSQTVSLADLQRLEYEWRCVPLAGRHPELTERFYGHLEGLL